MKAACLASEVQSSLATDRKGPKVSPGSLYLLAVDPGDFGAPDFGEVIRTPGRHGYHAYLPAPVPPRPELDAETVLVLSEADRALGRLAGAGRHLPDPNVLILPYITREALASSRIEGTQASLSDVLDVQARGVQATGDVAEVVNYIRGLRRGLDLVDELPVCMRLLREVHEVLLEDVRGAECRPGEIRTSQNWIGPAGATLETATFVPPPPDSLGKLLADFETYLHSEPELPPLVHCAMAHYQFETIHPFLDGNGRLGRLLIVFLLRSWDLLPEPLLYLSAWFETHRTEYYERLQAVRERGEVEEWLRFFLRGVAVQAKDALDRAERLSDIREMYRRRVTASRARLGEVVDLLVENPVVTAKRVSEALAVTPQSAMNYIRSLQELGMLTEIDPIPGRAKRWVAHEIYEVIDAGS